MNRAGLRTIRVGRLSALVRPKALACLSLFALMALGLLGFGLTHGSLPIPASAIGRALFSHETLTAETRYVVMDIRLPRLLMAVLCGAMLGMAGAAMQSITRNGLADPGLIGVKEGCSAAVLLLIFQFPALSLAWRPLVGMAGGLLTALLVIALARDISRPRFILIGIGVSWAFAAAMGVFMTTADVRDVQTAMLWLAGSLHAANWTLVGLAALIDGGNHHGRRVGKFRIAGLTQPAFKQRQGFSRKIVATQTATGVFTAQMRNLLEFVVIRHGH